MTNSLLFVSPSLLALPAASTRTLRPPCVCPPAVRHWSHRIPIRCTSQPTSPSTSDSEPLSTPTSSAEHLVKAFWTSASNGKYSDAENLFSTDAVYYDTLYPQPFRGRRAIAAHLRAMEEIMPSGIVFILDDIAASADRVGTRWHAETADGRAVPFSRGASMYSISRSSDGNVSISEAWDFPETPLKFAGVFLPLLRVAFRVLRLFDGTAA